MLSELSENFEYWRKLWADAAARSGLGLFVFMPDGYVNAKSGEDLEPSIWSLQMFKTQVLTSREDVEQLEGLVATLNTEEEFLALIVQEDGDAEFLKMNRGSQGTDHVA